MKIIRILLLITVCNLLCGCPDLDEVDAHIIIKNNSEIDIYWWARGSGDELRWKPNHTFLIEPNSSAKMGYIKNGSKYYIWLFDREVIDNTPWEDVVENEMYLIRYDLTLEDLEAMNWEVIYDGN